MNDDLKAPSFETYSLIDGGCANFVLQLGITFLFNGGHKIRFEGKGSEIIATTCNKVITFLSHIVL